mmetsp:Transcript_8332/g.5953  ORF Transcript_8332/g.5953 Transcript_8332/m.5953 type:complete len:143 (+) Transcript_8332:258-686(+)|eukprot:CAMPEP_0116873274 /NCGR_PEP_ID=MMETSP0463-20121206/4301_1 /TAXON_ID=181622 /ORGANISM="Strombidinopsis sp, Strain SopsisLIS2011" /LENGTH=142 /DNA_ID=CAMNT_0004514885 /DNA_START=247 /DNA_END=675 /DNA_ORIENTATION=-
MVMELLGPSLMQLFKKVCSQPFSVKTIALLGLQMVERLKFLADKGLVHRDLKPDNWCVGQGAHQDTVYLIDFGLAKKYRHDVTQIHIPQKQGKLLVGTILYASVDALLGSEITRKDDLESMVYGLIELGLGALPWDWNALPE